MTAMLPASPAEPDCSDAPQSARARATLPAGLGRALPDFGNLLRPDVILRHREVGEVDSGVLGRRPGRVVAAEEGREQNPFDLQARDGPEQEVFLVQDELLIEPDADAAVTLARRVEPDVLLDQVPFPRLETPLPPAEGGAVLDAGRQVGVDLAVAVLAPHEASREAVGAVRDAAPAPDRAPEQARELPPLDEVETGGEAHVIAEVQGVSGRQAEVGVELTAPERPTGVSGDGGARGPFR